MNTQAERTWNKRLRSARREVRDAKKKRRAATMGFLAYVGGAVGLGACCAWVNIGFIVLVLVWIAVGAGIIFSLSSDIVEAYMDVQSAKDELEDLQEAYGYAMMEAYEEEM